MDHWCQLDWGCRAVSEQSEQRESTSGGKLQLSCTVGVIQETVAALDINGVAQPRGTYGATGSGAQFIDDSHFSGTGMLNVTGVPEPGSILLTGAGVVAMVARLRRRRVRLNSPSLAVDLPSWHA